MERDYVITLGTMLFTMVEPTPGHEVEYNRWYERHSFYEKNTSKNYVIYVSK